MAAAVECRDGVSVVALCDAVGYAPDPLDTAFPALGRTGTWRLHVHCFLVRAHGRLVLVDTGVGPQWTPGAQWLSTPGRLPEELAAVGVAPDEVTDVVLTHMHADHVGWNVGGTGADAAVPLFANARHVVQERELARLRDGSSDHGALYRTHVRPLVERDMLAAVDGAHALLRHVDLVPTPGHTPGHQSVLVDGDRESVLLTGDVFVHDAQVRDPELVYCYEADPTEAVRSRRGVLDLARDRGYTLGPAHSDALFLHVATGAADPGAPATAVDVRPRAVCPRAAEPTGPTAR